MDTISDLPDDLLLKILSFIPTKEIPITSLLSKRWPYLWTFLPKLEFHRLNYQTNSDYCSFSQFVHEFLLPHKAPVLESLHLRLDQVCRDTDIESCFEIASNRNLRELTIQYGPLLPRLGFPRRMYETLVVMHLCCVDLNVRLITHSFRSLKTLHLLAVEYEGNNSGSFTNCGSLTRLLSKCPVLEDLLLEHHNPCQTITVAVPSLQRLSIIHSPNTCFRLKTPFLKHLKIQTCVMEWCSIQNMPHIVTADLTIFQTNLRKLPGSLTSLKRLSLCLVAPLGQVPKKTTKIFHQLLHLSLCTCYRDWLSYLKWIIEASPKLQTLKLHNDHHCSTRIYKHISDKDINIPKCSLPHLEIFEWRGYEGTPQNRKLASYIFTKATALKKARISSELNYAEDKKKDEILKALMRKEFSLLSKNSNTHCHVSFH